MVIVVGLSESVNHSEISIKVEVAIIGLVIALIVAYFIVAAVDIVTTLFFEKLEVPKAKGLKFQKNEKSDGKKKLWTESQKEDES